MSCAYWAPKSTTRTVGAESPAGTSAVTSPLPSPMPSPMASLTSTTLPAWAIATLVEPRVARETVGHRRAAPPTVGGRACPSPDRPWDPGPAVGGAVPVVGREGPTAQPARRHRVRHLVDERPGRRALDPRPRDRQPDRSRHRGPVRLVGAAAPGRARA